MSKNNRKAVPRQYAIVILMTLSIVIIAILTYAHILGYFFTAVDTLSLIDTSRIQSSKDLVSVFTQPLMGGTQFAGHTLYFRPITSLFYALDYYIWGLNPFGYHLTDLILHVTVSALVFIFMFFLTGGRKTISWLSAVIFTTHPVLVECVPAIARRHDMIAAMFQLSSLILFLNYISAPKGQRKWSLTSSILVFALSLGSKEISILLPLVIFGYLFVFNVIGDENKSFRIGILRSIKTCLPYFLLTVIYVVWRGHVLGGVGGVNITSDFSYRDTLTSYITDLLYPVPFLGAAQGNLLLAMFLVIAFILFALLFINRREILSKMQSSDTARIVSFLSIWLFLPLALLLATRTFSHWNMYVSVISFSAILSIILVESFQLAFQRPTAEATATRLRWLPYAAVGSFVTAAGLIISLLFFSPITQSYGEWKDSGTISEIVLNKVSDVTSSLPDNSTIHIYDLPAGILTYQAETPHVQSIRYLADYSIKSYLDMTDPDNQIKVIVENTIDLPTHPETIDLEVTTESDNNVVIIIRSD